MNIKRRINLSAEVFINFILLIYSRAKEYSISYVTEGKNFVIR